MSHKTQGATLAPVERTSLAAAGLINAVGSLLDELVETSTMPRQDIAAALGVTPARISQVLGGDGNVRIATLARIVDACNATISMTATLRSTGESVSVPRPATRRRRPSDVTRNRTQAPPSDVEGTSLAAAALINAVGSLMEQTIDLSGVLRRDIAAAMGVTPGRVSQIVDGDGNVRVATLARLMEAAGADLSMTATTRSGAVITVRRQPMRRRASAKARTAEVVDLPSRRAPASATRPAATTRNRLRELVPLRELVARGVLPADTEAQPAAVCELLGLADLWDEPQFAAVARRHNATQAATHHQRAWLACARAAARSGLVADLDVAGLRELAAGLTRELIDPTAFAGLPPRFADVGVRLVHVEQFSGGKISGVAFRLDANDRAAVIALSGRGRRLDKVLFTLLHESAHVVLGHTHANHVVLDIDMDDAASAREADANALAASWVLPEPLTTPREVTAAWIEEEAAQRGIHPIVLIGRLQSDGDLPWNSTLCKGAPTVIEQFNAWSNFREAPS